MKSSVSDRQRFIPRSAIIIDTTFAIILFGIGIYHFTQPNQAWRSGTAEFISTALLLTAAYLVNRPGAMAIHLIVAVSSCALGTRHLIHGGGWKSGITELFLAIVLIVIAVKIYNYGKARVPYHNNSCDA